ncbi:MAG TPA: AgmX/PglI C-terminal domain-containing protein [Kofleriaceae bacterium]|nr:AgmX/PglI C-terminal domain-containing protein [Kofleriaceae bacterium]
MKRVVPLLLVACGGSKPPPPKEPPPPVEKKVTRVPIETNEDEPEDGVTFTKQKGSISKEKIDAGLAPHQQAMMDCYTTKVGKRRFVGGEARLMWELKADGAIKSVKLDSNLGAWDIEKCLLDVAWSATFDKPTGADAEFDLPLQFAATRSTAIWDEDMALRAVGGQLALLDECPNGDPLHKNKPGKKPPKKVAKKAPKKAPPPEAPAGPPERPEPRPPSNVTVTMYIGPLGKAQSIGFSSPTSEVGSKWAKCASEVAASWRLPDPRGQIAKLAIRYKAE